MPGFDDLKNAAKDVASGMVDNAKEAAEEIINKDLNGDGVIGDGVEDGPVYGDTASVVDTINEIRNNPDTAKADFVNAAKDAAGDAMGAVSGLAGAAAQKAEELTGKDINGDGTVAGAAPAAEAPAAEAAADEATEAPAAEAAADEATEAPAE